MTTLLYSAMIISIVTSFIGMCTYYYFIRTKGVDTSFVRWTLFNISFSNMIGLFFTLVMLLVLHIGFSTSFSDIEFMFIWSLASFFNVAAIHWIDEA